MSDNKKCQTQVMNLERKKLGRADRTFMEIMNGPNPLSKEELRHLVETRGGIWRRYEKFLN